MEPASCKNLNPFLEQAFPSHQGALSYCGLGLFQLQRVRRVPRNDRPDSEVMSDGGATLAS